MISLMKDEISNRKIPSPPAITTLPKPLRDNHDWQNMKGNRTCVQCRADIKDRDFDREISGNRKNPPRTRDDYTVCNVFLCRKGDCVKRFHSKKTIMESKE